jgi:RNA ligase
MQVINYLKENGTEKLKQEFGIIVKEYVECGLIVLNYDQIHSPKTHEIVKECRGLILDHNFNVVSRSFDRFFNYGENETTFNVKTAYACEKIDGSLIKIYHYQNLWHISTRGTAFAESEVNGFDLTFEGMVLRALNCANMGQFQKLCQDALLDKDYTYIFEITGVENRVVTRYSGYTLWFLACRHIHGLYVKPVDLTILLLGAKIPKRFSFGSVEECLETAKALPDLQEGYVIYEAGVPVCKVKSPAYVVAHKIKGEGLNPRHIATLIALNEQEEYLAYFEEDRNYFNQPIAVLESVIEDAQKVYDSAKDVADQKDFALKVKDYPFCNFLFQARKLKESDIRAVFNNTDTNQKVKFLLTLMER